MSLILSSTTWSYKGYNCPWLVLQPATKRLPAS